MVVKVPKSFYQNFFTGEPNTAMDSGRAGCVIQYNASSLKKYLSSEVSSSAMSWIAERLADL